MKLLTNVLALLGASFIGFVELCFFLTLGLVVLMFLFSVYTINVPSILLAACLGTAMMVVHKLNTAEPLKTTVIGDIVK